MFDLGTVPNIIIKEISYNDIDIVQTKDMPKEFLLYNKGIRWMVLDQYSNKQIKEMYSQYDMAYGDVLITGFGFGVLANWIASKPEVTSVTVLEISKDIYDVYLKNNFLSDKVNVIITDASNYKTDQHYDCLFLDHYEYQLHNWVFRDMEKVAKNIPNHNVFWGWSLEVRFIEAMSDLKNSILEATMLYNNSLNFYDLYEEFRSKKLNIPTLPKLNKSKLNEYVYTYFDRLGYSVL